MKKEYNKCCFATEALATKFVTNRGTDERSKWLIWLSARAGAKNDMPFSTTFQGGNNCMFLKHKLNWESNKTIIQKYFKGNMYPKQKSNVQSITIKNKYVHSMKRPSCIIKLLYNNIVHLGLVGNIFIFPSLLSLSIVNPLSYFLKLLRTSAWEVFLYAWL